MKSDDFINEATLDVLRQAIGEDAMRDFLGRFLEDCAKRMDRILLAYEKGKFAEIELEAHTLGSSAATYGAHQLEDICRDIEMAKPLKDSAFQSRIEQLKTIGDQSIQALKEYL